MAAMYHLVECYIMGMLINSLTLDVDVTGDMYIFVVIGLLIVV